jgi:hypothetical protein
LPADRVALGDRGRVVAGRVDSRKDEKPLGFRGLRRRSGDYSLSKCLLSCDFRLAGDTPAWATPSRVVILNRSEGSAVVYRNFRVAGDTAAIEFPWSDSLRKS